MITNYPRIHYTWNEFERHIDSLCSILVKRRKTNKKPLPTHVYGIPRGGWVIAVALSHRLEIKLIERKEDITKIVNYEEKVLIVDEICDSGKTLTNFFKGIKNGDLMETLVIHRRIGSYFYPDYEKVLVTTKQHVVYPWEGAYNGPRKSLE